MSFSIIVYSGRSNVVIKGPLREGETSKNERINSLSNNNFLDWSKLKAFAEDKINATLQQKLFLGWVENIVGKGENAA